MSRGDLVLRSKTCTTMGSLVRGDVPLAPLEAVGIVPLERLATTMRMEVAAPEYFAEVARLFASEQHFCAAVFGSPGPRPAALALTDSGYLSHLEYLCSVGVLEVAARRDLVFTARYFAVAKDVCNDGAEGGIRAVSARAIFNVAALNDSGCPAESFSLFSVTQLLQALARDRPQFFTVADVKNCYYEFLLPPWMRKYCGIAVRQPETGALVFFRCRVLPMGWTWSCRVAQAITAAMVQLGNGVLGWPPAINLERTPPALVALDGGGTVALIYDTIFIASQRAPAARAWEAALFRNFAATGLQAKYITTAKTATFSGMDFEVTREGLRWRVAHQTFEQWQVVILSLQTTPRGLWQALGIIRRYCEVQRIERREIAAIARHQAMLASKYAEQARDATADFWDMGGIVCLETMACATRLVQSWSNPWACGARLVSRRRTRAGDVNELQLVVVDATPTRLSACLLDRDRRVLLREVSRDAEQEHHIDVMEVRAIALGLELAEGQRYVVLGSDNTAASRACWRGYSLSEDMNSWLPRIPLEQQVVFVDIPSEENFADIFTRPERLVSQKESEQRLEATLRRLETAWKQWQSDAFSNGFYWRNDLEMEDV